MLLGFQFAMDSEAQTMNQRREESPGRGQELGLPAARDREWHQESGLFAACWVKDSSGKNPSGKSAGK